MEPPIVHLLARPEPAGDEEGVHRWLVTEAVIGKDGEARLGLNGPTGIRDEKGVELRVETPSHREDAVWSGEIDDLGVLEHVNPETETSRASGHDLHSFH